MKHLLICVLLFLSGVIFTIINIGINNENNEVKKETLYVIDTIHRDTIIYNEFVIQQVKETLPRYYKSENDEYIKLGDTYKGYTRRRAPIIKQDTVKTPIKKDSIK